MRAGDPDASPDVETVEETPALDGDGSKSDIDEVLAAFPDAEIVEDEESGEVDP